MSQKDLEQKVNNQQKIVQESEEKKVKVTKKAAAGKLDDALRKHQGGKQKGQNESKESPENALDKKGNTTSKIKKKERRERQRNK
jgi:hypothetical protein